MFEKPKLNDLSNVFWEKIYKDKWAGNIIRREKSDGSWQEYQYDKDNNVISYLDNKGYWYKIEYQNGLKSHYCNNNGFVKYIEYHSNGNIKLIKQSEDFGVNFAVFEYNLEEDLISERYSDGTVFNFTYVNGKIIKTDSNNQIIETINERKMA